MRGPLAPLALIVAMTACGGTCPQGEARTNDGVCVDVGDTAAPEEEEVPDDTCQSTDDTVCYNGNVHYVNSCGEIEDLRAECEQECIEGSGATCADVSFRCFDTDYECTDYSFTSYLDVEFTCEVFNNGPDTLWLDGFALYLTDSSDESMLDSFYSDGASYIDLELPPGEWSEIRDYDFDIRFCGELEDEELELEAEMGIEGPGASSTLWREADSSEEVEVSESWFSCFDDGNQCD